MGRNQPSTWLQQKQQRRESHYILIQLFFFLPVFWRNTCTICWGSESRESSAFNVVKIYSSTEEGWIWPLHSVVQVKGVHCQHFLSKHSKIIVPATNLILSRSISSTYFSKSRGSEKMLTLPLSTCTMLSRTQTLERLLSASVDPSLSTNHFTVFKFCEFLKFPFLMALRPETLTSPMAWTATKDSSIGCSAAPPWKSPT